MNISLGADPSATLAAMQYDRCGVSREKYRPRSRNG
jgi:hypothetical protein